MLRRASTIILLALMVCPVSARIWHVCMKCPDSDFKVIGDALNAAAPGDTILVYWETGFPYFLENLVIDKPVRIISNAAAGDLDDFDLYPVITALRSPIVKITVPGVEFIGFNIRNLTPPQAAITDDCDFNREVGISMEAPATIRSCAITDCGTGILRSHAAETCTTAGLIEKCRIGLPPDYAVESIRNTGNLFGIVSAGPSKGSVKSAALQIVDCLIMRNRFYGVVYTPSMPVVLRGNIIETNGKRPFRIAADVLDEKGRFVWMDTD